MTSASAKWKSLQLDPSVVQPDQACGPAARGRGKDVKLERSPGLNLVRAERSGCCIFAYVEKRPQEKFDRTEELVGNTSDICVNSVAVVANMSTSDEFSREETLMILDLLPGESRGYWKHHAPGKWFKQAKACGKINNSRADLLFDSGAEVSILDIAFARKAGCRIDTSVK